MSTRLLALYASVVLAGLAAASPNPVAPANMPRVGTVAERFQSFNVEMVEVTGGRFWKPYGAEVDAILKSSNQPAGLDPALFQYRPPIDLSNARLRKLASALGPAYVRVSGTWANSTYFHDADTPAPKTPPTGFNGILTRQQWKGVVDFSRAVDAHIVTSVATSAGARDADLTWTPQQARQFFAYTKSVGGSIAAAEFMNEPNFASIGGAPKGYDAAAFARDLALFRSFAKEVAPDMMLLGPGSVGEGTPWLESEAAGPLRFLKSEDLLGPTGKMFDIFSYHFYGAISNRCGAMTPKGSTTAAAALTEEWLARTGIVLAFYGGLRDRFVPGKPLWVTETADAACGGNPWGSSFLDSFRYLDQLGRLARAGVNVIFHNTLAASDYGLLDETTLAPRPNYWAAWMWRRFMGATVLDPGSTSAPGLHLYAHNLRGVPGGVALLVINTDRTESKSIELATAAERYTLSARHLSDSQVQMNGTELKLGANDALPLLKAVAVPLGTVTFAPASITFLAIPGANNSASR